MSMNGAPSPARPWWKEPWPWILIGLLGTAFAASVVTIAIALRHGDSAVRAPAPLSSVTPPPAGAELAKQQRARAMHLEGVLRQDGEKLRLVLSQPVDEPVLSLEFRHPYAQKGDLRVDLQRSSAGVYTGHAALGRVRYTVWIETAQWRLSGTLKPDQPASLQPGM